jgi:two-component system response regulator HydG
MSLQPHPLLVVDDDRANVESIQRTFEKEKIEVLTAGDGREALDLLRQRRVGVVLTDLMMPGMSGLELLRAVKTVSPETEVILMTAFGTVETAVEAMKDGAWDFVTKPFKRIQIVKAVRRALDQQSLVMENLALKAELQDSRRDRSIVGNSLPIRQLLDMVRQVAPSLATVLLQGESGTGKELVARAIHFSGARRERPFVAVNCGAIPASLLESELFGHVRGAFTNATSDKKGLFEVAHTGTLFLDEIGEMPLEMQVKLLRVLQSGDIQKVGAVKQVTVDVRIVTATNRKLDEEVAAGRFREDLFYRLSVVPIVVPPLRERRDDIPLLVQHFIEANKKSGLGQVQSISKDALALLQRYAWPGNVRQLETVMKNASVFCDGTVLYPQDFTSFPDIVCGGGGPGGTTPNDKTDATSLSLSGRTLADLERLAIVQALKDNKGNKKKTAEQLGIDRRTLYNKLASYGIAIESDLKVT